jgi:large subunit ribosomal protein L25
VAGERVKLIASERTLLGSAESRRLRKQGLIPGVLYGRSEPVSFSVAERDLRAALTTPAGSHAVLEVAVGERAAHSAILKDYQRDKVRGTITHIDLQEVRLDQPIQTAVTLTLIGEPVGVKEGGVLAQVTNEINIEALPLEVPQHLELDISELQIGESVRLSELVLPAGVTLLDDPEETVLATITHQRAEEEPVEAAEPVEGEEPGASAEDAESEGDSGEGDSES